MYGLFILALISLISMQYCFIGNIYHKKSNYRIQMTYMDYYGEEDIPPEYSYNPLDYESKEADIPLFIVIWNKSEQTRKILHEMERQGLHTYFMEDAFDDTIQISTTEMPLVYKNEVLLESWMEIYAEMYPM